MNDISNNIDRKKAYKKRKKYEVLEALKAIKGMKQKILEFIKNEMVLFVAAAFAAASMCIVPPMRCYLTYFDFSVLALLFCLMAVVNGLKEKGIFHQFARALLSRIRNMRRLSEVLVFLCFFSSMFVTNDVALLTFVPFSILILTYTKQKKYLIYVLVLQTIAANLGSMLTPMGNPQNLYLYQHFHLKAFDFMAITFPITAFSSFLLLLACQFVKKENVQVTFTENIVLKKSKIVVGYAILFFLCLLAVSHLLHYMIALVAVCIFIFFLDRKNFLSVDYSLLLTFTCFFIFVGNLGQIDSFCAIMNRFLEGREEVVAVVLSQLISNVPAAVLLSGFTYDAHALVVGTNIGGLGTLVASLASLISFKLYAKVENAKPLRYIVTFTGLNALFLIILMTVF